MNSLEKMHMSGITCIKIDNFLQLPYHVYLKDRKGKYLECNPAQAKSFGRVSANEIIGMTDKDFHSQAEAKILRVNDMQTQKTETPAVLIEQCTFSNKPTAPMLSYKIPAVGLNGKVIGIFGTSISFDGRDNLLSQISLSNNNLPQNNNTILHQDNECDLIKRKHLSKRERECIENLIQGKTAKEIARILDLSHRTIEFYIENLKKKFNCLNRAELIAKTYHMFNYLDK